MKKLTCQKDNQARHSTDRLQNRKFQSSRSSQNFRKIRWLEPYLDIWPIPEWNHDHIPMKLQFQSDFRQTFKYIISYKQLLIQLTNGMFYGFDNQNTTKPFLLVKWMYCRPQMRSQMINQSAFSFHIHRLDLPSKFYLLMKWWLK